MSKFKPTIIFILFLLTGGFLITGCNNGKPAAETYEEVSVITPVTITPVNFGPVA